MDPYYDLGSYSRKITTTNETAQKWFDRGLIWAYAFNHEEARECFEKAIRADSRCAMASWGVAYTAGPNYNFPWEAFDPATLQRNTAMAVQAAGLADGTALLDGCTEVERGLIKAIRARYQGDMGDRERWNLAYADAMRDLYFDHPEDLDVAALYADALMNLTPWALWDLRSGKPAEGARTLEAKAVLELAMNEKGGYKHPGLLHFYIHLMEMSPTPEAALKAADNLRGLCPDAGHLNHMPTHLDVLCGDYRRVIKDNFDAICADERWLAREGPLNFYSLYRAHNYHFRIYGACLAGQFRVGFQTAECLESSLPEELLRTMADELEGFLPMRLHVLIRFGRWNDILELELPKNKDLYCVTTAMTLYARVIALANTDRIVEADKEMMAFTAAKGICSLYADPGAGKVAESRTVFNNQCIEILRVAWAMAHGEIEYRRGDIEMGIKQLRVAAELSDKLPYDEPWGWMQPPRHALGALLLEQGRVEEAMAEYSADLGLDDTLPRALQHPNNVWALHGYHECLVRLDRQSEARFAKKQLDLVAATADVTINSSCFCRREGLQPHLKKDEDTRVMPWRFNKPIIMDDEQVVRCGLVIKELSIGAT